MSYSFPEYSSSPAPSTPDKKSSNLFSFDATNPSTTPAGPPPSSAGSFTPAGAPPTTYGSSVFGNTSIKPISFAQSNVSNGSPLKFGQSVTSEGYTPVKSGFQESNYGSRHNQSQNRGFGLPEYSDDEDEEHNGEESAEEDAMEEVEQEIDGEYYEEEEDRRSDSNDQNYENEEEMENDQNVYRRSGTDTSDRNDFTRSLVDFRPSLRQSTSAQLPQDTVYSSIAKDLISQMNTPELTESDTVILNTDDRITRLYGAKNNEELLDALSDIPGQLLKLWRGFQKQVTPQEFGSYNVRIGPGPEDAAFSKANFIASLILRINHPQTDQRLHQSKQLPEALLEWLNEYHDPYPSQIEDLAGHRPSPANSTHFWNTIFNSLLRGRITPVIQLLRDAGWRHAITSEDDGTGRTSVIGLAGVALSNVEHVVASVVDVLAQCPGRQGDWDVTGDNWVFFRLKASQALSDLQKFAEGANYQNKTSNATGPYSRTAQEAQSAVPWAIYQRLKQLYGLLKGDGQTISDMAQDWCEATIGLAVWWSDSRSDGKKARGLLDSRNFANQESVERIYLQKLRRAFTLITTSEQELEVNTTDPVEVALASTFEGDNESAIGFLQAWSGPVSTAVAEIGSVAGWLPQSEPQALINMDELDDEDLIALGHSPSPSKSDSVKDKTLIAYATSLKHRDSFGAHLPEGHVEKEGWELAISTLGRLDSISRSEQIVGVFLQTFELNSSTRVDKLWTLLSEIDMKGHAERTAESYANSLADSSHKYGEALWYYALAHKKTKVKDVLDLLISYSLVQSIAYPAEADMDRHLANLMNHPREAISAMSQLDGVAAELLYHAFTGYATLRSYYNIRDGSGSSTESGKFALLSRNRQSEAVSALLAVINSSGESINGGLYDEDAETVVNVDYLLALLCEALVFVNHTDFRLKVTDIDVLLKAVEDLEGVGPRVYAACTEFLQTVLASAHGLKGSTPADLLKKSTSNLSGSSSFSMVGSSMLASQLKHSMNGSGMLASGKIRRGWDWRNGLSATTTPEDILRLLRLGLAKKLASAWLAEVDNLI